MVRAAFVERVEHDLRDRGQHRSMELDGDTHILRDPDGPYSPAFRVETVALTRKSC